MKAGRSKVLQEAKAQEVMQLLTLLPRNGKNKQGKEKSYSEPEGVIGKRGRTWSKRKRDVKESNVWRR